VVLGSRAPALNRSVLTQYLVRSEQQRWRDRQTERLGGLDVDHQLELYRSLDGQIVRCRTLEDAIGIARRACNIIEEVIPVRQQPAHFNEVAKRLDRRKPVASRQCRYLCTLGDQERIRHDDKTTIPLGGRAAMADSNSEVLRTGAAIASTAREAAACLKGLR